jgi:hypothetical protein
LETDDPASGDTMATADQLREAIEAMTDDDALRLRLAAAACLPGTEFQDHLEVIHEAIRRAMDAALGLRGRHWPINRVPFVAFMIRTMESIANGSRESHAVSKTDRFDGLVLEGTAADHPLDRLGFVTPSVETQAIEAEDDAELVSRAVADTALIEAFFAGDEEVGWLILCLKEGRSAAKARELAGYSTTKYENIRKRMRRGIAKLFPGRRPHD